jgi:O-antigen/teichoic acid export membrane protein
VQTVVGRGNLSANIAASTINVVVVVGASLVAVPLLIDRLGIAGYGLWALAQTVILYVTTAELGFGPALARFTSVHAGDPDRPRHVLVAALSLYTVAGLLVVALCHLLAEPLVGLFSVPAAMKDDAVATVGLVGWVSLVALLAGALGHILYGLERFASFTWTNMVGSVAFLVAIFVLMADRARLQDAAYAALAQWGIVALLRLMSLRDIAFSRGSRLPGRALMRDLIGFSARLQAAVLANLLNTQTDRVVVGAVASARTVGYVSIATQVADAARALSAAALNPMISRMAVTYGSEGEGALDELLARQRRLWTIGLVGGIAVSVGAARPAIAAWLGSGYDRAALFAAMLIAAYGIGQLPGPAFAYLRARGNPGLEGKFGLVTVAANLIGTIALAVIFGATGVVVATLIAYVLATAWVTRRARAAVPPATHAPIEVPRIGAACLVAGAAAYGAGMGLLEIVPRGVALVGIGIAAATIYTTYLAALTDLRPLDSLRSATGSQRPSRKPA